MSDLRISDLSQLSGPVERDLQNLILDDGTNVHRALLSQLLGSGSGAANSLVFKEEITEITDDMYDSIADGSFDKVHAGMHYTAPSGRTYYLADADYFFGTGGTEQTNHHMLVIEDEINHTAQHQTTNVTTGGATSSLIYTTTLPSIQGELETDFGADHIITQSVLLCNTVSSGIPSSWAWADKASMIMNANMVFGHPILYSGNTGEMFNGGNRHRQLSLFKAMPETIVARTAGTTTRAHWWLDDTESAAYFGHVDYVGYARTGSASAVVGVRRAFLIG